MAYEKFFRSLEDLPTEGNRGFRALCGLARSLGYDTEPKQLYNSDGTTVSSLINMLEDNPVMIEAIIKVVSTRHRRTFEDLLDEQGTVEDEDEEEENEEEGVREGNDS